MACKLDFFFSSFLSGREIINVMIGCDSCAPQVDINLFYFYQKYCQLKIYTLHVCCIFLIF